MKQPELNPKENKVSKMIPLELLEMINKERERFDRQRDRMLDQLDEMLAQQKHLLKPSILKQSFLKRQCPSGRQCRMCRCKRIRFGEITYIVPKY